MRVLLLSALLAAMAMAAPAAAPLARADTPITPKVVIIVGPAGSATAGYRSDAMAAANAAARYTSTVVTIESPNATWDVVAPALQGASIVVYMGHGNGFPSPYASTLQPDREDGLGLNPTAGVDDTATRYWGEQYLATAIRLAPNAVVILGHLCYASGSSEPGYPDPSADVARQRTDNFAAGFIAAGARAVIAEAYSGSTASYIDRLFTAHDSVSDIWANAPSRQGIASSFASVRSAGMTEALDPDRSSGKYYRSFVGDTALLSDAVIKSTTSAPVATPSPTPTLDPTASPTPSPAPTPSPSPVIATPATAIPSGADPAAVALRSIRWTTTAVRLRARASTSSHTLAILPANMAARVLAISRDSSGRVWYRAWTKSGTGWLASWLTRESRTVAVTTPPSNAVVAGWQTGRATSYGTGDGLLGRTMACGAPLTVSIMAVAHRSLPCGTTIRLDYGGREVDAQVLDRGPYTDGITLDLAPAVCQALGACGTLTLEWLVVR